MEYVFYNHTSRTYLKDDEDSSVTRNLQNAMIAVGEETVHSVQQRFPQFEPIPVTRENPSTTHIISLSSKKESGTL